MGEQSIHIPGWKIIREIGEGGFSCVYEVEKEGDFSGVAHSAMKVISIPERASDIEEYRLEGLDDVSMTALFKSRVDDITSEFRLMSKLKGCSNIVSFEDHWVVQHEKDPGYDIFIRMELLTPLLNAYDRELKEHGYNDSYPLRVGVDICRALELCSHYKIIHRDIKPQNIFVNELGDYKLGDFGIAKTSDHTTRATKAGTFGYMAPEVYLSKPYNASVDICSLGLVMYWMLNERRGPFVPLPPEVPKTSQNEEALNRRMSGEPLPAPKNGSEELKRIVLKACAFDPKDRYASPTEMKRDLLALTDVTTQFAITPLVEKHDPAASMQPEPEYEKTVGIFWDRTSATPPIITEANPKQRPLTETKPPVSERKPSSQPTQAETAAKKPTHEKKTNKKIWIPLTALLIALALAATAVVLLLTTCDSCNANPETAEAPAKLNDGNTPKLTETPTQETIETPMPEPTETLMPEPTETPAPEPTETPMPETTQNPVKELICSFMSASVGEAIAFGRYEQDGDDSNGKEAIEWIVLAKEDNGILVISKYALDCQPYHTTQSAVTWETCFLRTWLNETFLQDAFSEDEQAIIRLTKVTADNNPAYHTPYGNDTEDRIFLISIAEVNEYFNSDDARKCALTHYAISQYIKANKSKSVGDTIRWWLRSPGSASNCAARVKTDGSISYYGSYVDGNNVGVRPALWIDFGSENF
ncbi:MAG: protein kinase [Clostridia bacterium]|nr:protein kinase [Clostridia bacterium]